MRLRNAISEIDLAFPSRHNAIGKIDLAFPSRHNAIGELDLACSSRHNAIGTSDLPSPRRHDAIGTSDLPSPRRLDAIGTSDLPSPRRLDAIGTSDLPLYTSTRYLPPSPGRTKLARNVAANARRTPTSDRPLRLIEIAMHHRLQRHTRTLITALVLMIALAAIPSRPHAAHAAPTPDVVLLTSGAHRANDAQPDPRGFKSWLIKQALEYMASAIRAGNYVIHEIIRRLDAKAAKAFRKHADSIADGLDDIAKIPDLTVGIVREKLRYFLIDQLGMNHGTAEVIVGAVEAVLYTFL